MRYLGLFATIFAVLLGTSSFWSASIMAGPNTRYGIIVNAGYSTFKPDSDLRAEDDNSVGYRLGIYFDPDGEADRGFEFDISWVNYGKYEYCLKDISSAALQTASLNADTTSRLGQVCSNYETDGLELGATYVVPLSRLSNRRSVLDKFSGFFGGGYSDLDFNASHANVRGSENDEGFYWEAGFLWTGGFGKRAENLGIRASYRAHDNNGIEYWSIGLTWDL